VLTSWIEAGARSQGYAAQATSVAGVAQRTGATIYYIEMAPINADSTAMPVFSLAPSGGDVDIMIAAEMMEAGRAILRGFVTPDRTTLIASTHRTLALSEKMAPGDGIASTEEVRAAAEIAADQLILFDMDRLAVENGSVISSALFGALAGSGALPFARAAFEEAIRASGKGVEPSLRAFGAAYARAQSDDPESAEYLAENHPEADLIQTAQGPAHLMGQWQALEAEARALPGGEMALHGLRKVVGFQDLAYGRAYLDHIRPFAEQDRGDAALAEAAAKHIANAMCYDDIIRVADLKTRKARFARIHTEMNSGSRPVLLTEFFHPRGEEIISLLPARLGAWVEARPRLAAWIDRRLNKGRRIRTHRLRGFILLYGIAGLRRTRRYSLRHRIEQAHLQNWLTLCQQTIPRNYDCAVELLQCRRLIKGYSDTHARGLSKFARVLDTLPALIERDDAAQWIARLREAALGDEEGTALEGAIKTVMSFASSPAASS
jgi:indolepyruvate ferredoxin oxidoreductase beta subunit